MDAFLAALGLVFIAELGDKTQLVALGFGARHGVIPVIAGMTLGYGAVSLLAVLLGGALGAALPERALGIGGGILFLGFALWTLRGDDENGDEGTARTAGRSVVVAVALGVGLAELGDKTMLATAALAAKNDPVLTWVGATLGEVSAGTLGVVAGRMLGARISPKVTRYVSAGLFAAFGVGLIIASA